MKKEEISLSERNVTGSPNGYPEPYIGKFYYGFDNLDQAKKYADETGGYVRTAEWKDGWSNCILGGTRYEEFTASTDDYGDNYEVIDTPEELRNAAYFMIDDSMDEDEKQAWQESGDELISCCKDIDWEKYSVILHCGDFYEKILKKSMVWNWDTRTVVIGVVIFSDQD